MDLNSISNNQKADELLNAQAHVWNHLFNFINSMSLLCAIQLEIPDVIQKHGKPMTLLELVEALPIDKAKEQCVYRLMRILVHTGFFQISESDEYKYEKGYLLTPSCRLLLKDEPFSIRPFYQAMLDPIVVTPWHSLSQWFKSTEQTPFETAHGRSLWKYAADDPNFNNIFNSGMASDTKLVTSLLIREGKGVFEGINSLVDVGGGTGTVARAITDAFPHLHCQVFDLPHVVANFEGRNNLSFVGGNMFEAISNADAVLLKWVLHDWSDAECLKILSRCKEAIPGKQKGKVIIVDMVVDDGENRYYKGKETQLFFDMLMMVLPGGKEGTEKNWDALFKSAGFSDYKITPLLGVRSLIEVFP